MLHLKIDWTEFVRRYIWFGWQCVAVYDGKGQWRYPNHWRYRITPFCKRTWEIEEWTLNEYESNGAGYKIYDPVIK